MSTETAPAQGPARPRTWLLVLLGAAVAAFVAYWTWAGTSSSQAAPSNQQRQARGAGPAQPAVTDPASLSVRLGDLQTPPPEPSEGDRNPFRFQPKAPPPPPPTARPAPGQPGNAVNALPPGPPPPPPVPPIPLKFIGTLEGRGAGKLAIFSDNRGTPVYGHEGDIILGQYRVVRIGVESVVMEYADGRGRQTIPLRGQ